MSAGVEKTRLIEVLSMTLVPDNSVRRSAELELSRVCGAQSQHVADVWAPPSHDVKRAQPGIPAF